MDGTNSNTDTPVTRGRSRPVRFRLLDKDGGRHGTYRVREDAYEEAKRLGLGDPNMSDDEPDGWYLESTKFKAPKRPRGAKAAGAGVRG